MDSKNELPASADPDPLRRTIRRYLGVGVRPVVISTGGSLGNLRPSKMTRLSREKLFEDERLRRSAERLGKAATDEQHE